MLLIVEFEEPLPAEEEVLLPLFEELLPFCEPEVEEPVPLVPVEELELLCPEVLEPVFPLVAELLFESVLL